MVNSIVAPNTTFSWNLLPWNLILKESVQHRQGRDSMELFNQMLSQCFLPDKITLITLLSACSKFPDVALGRRFHAMIRGNEWESDVVVATSLLSMYSKGGCIKEALKIFHGMPFKNVVTWNAILNSFLRYGKVGCVFWYFGQMQAHAMRPNRVTILTLLDACSDPSTHSCSIQLLDPCSSKIIDSYSNQLMDSSLENLNNPSSNNMIDPCLNQLLGPCSNTLIGSWSNQFISPLENESINPCSDKLMASCSNPLKLEQGRQVHACIIRESLDTDVIIMTSLINMYGKLDKFEDAHRIFSMLKDRDAVLWSSMIALTAHQGCGKEAYKLYEQMKQEGSMPDIVTFVSVLDAYASDMNLRDGKHLHASIAHMDLQFETNLLTCLINMYGKCSDIGNARDMFDAILQPSVVSWNAMLAIYAYQERYKEAFQTFNDLQQVSILPNSATFPSILDACANHANLYEGKRIDILIRNSGFENDLVVETALVNMYGKCGNLEVACTIFEEMETRNAITWTALIAAFAQNGQYSKAIQLFDQMAQEGIKPDAVTFVTILSACRHGGCVDEALQWLNLMKKYALTPCEKHYECVIDLLGKAGRLDEAEDLMKELPYMPTIMTWTALLQSCINQTDINRGERIAKGMFKMDSSEPAPYLILSKIYSAVGRHGEAEKFMHAMNHKG